MKSSLQLDIINFHFNLSMQVYLRTPDSLLHSLSIPLISDSCSLDNLKDQIYQKTGILVEDQSLILNGKFLYNSFQLFRVKSGSIIDVNLNLQGGKGGFGSLLRGQAIAKRKITNFDSSRDLQGRRIRNVTLHKKMLEWVKKKKEEDERIQKEINEFKEQQKNTLRAQSDIKLKQEFKDKIEKWENELGSSIKEGLKRKSTKTEDSEVKSKEVKKVKTESDATKPETENGNMDKITSKLSMILAQPDSDKTTTEENKKPDISDKKRS